MKVRLVKIMIALGVVALLNSVSFAQSQSTFQDPLQVLTGTKLSNYKSALNRLKAGFDEVCGDTFCEGDFSNLSSIDLTCSLSVANETLTDCAWTFVGVASEVNSENGSVDTSNQMLKTCHLDVAKVTLEEFTASINQKKRTQDASQKNALQVIFKGKTSSLYDQIARCL
ncbi:MAG: hypothetical protein H7333_06715 [Bdellovibrionales bacterium]|nr:hypothetical protein [Oligoflexia bacterium]